MTSDPAGLVAGDEGKMWYRSDLNVVKYWDGSTAIALGVAGAGITNINGLTAGTQSFVLGTAGTDIAISSAGSAHTFDIPTASATNRGALSSADWLTFNAKQSSSLASAKIWVGNSGGAATEVSMSGDATLDNAGALTLASSGVTAGTYSKVTVDAKGRVTSGGSLATTDLPSLPDGSIWVGNSGNTATAAAMSGDVTMTNAGVTSLANSGVTAGTYSKVTVDAKGRVTVGADLVSSDIISMLGYTPVNKAGDVMMGNLSLSSVTSDPAGLVAGDEGKMWYRSDLNTIRYWDGASAISLGVAGAGITNINGLTSSTQSFVIGTAGTAPAISSAGSAHTLDIPMASTAAVTAGLISKTDYDTFNAKQSSSLASAKIWVGNSGGAATEVSMSGDATIDNAGALSIGAGKITAPMLSSGGVVTATSGVMIAGTTGNLVNFACATSGHVLKWSVTGWTCAFADPSLPTLASGKVWIGNAGNAATEVSLSGDATVDNAGAVTLANSGVTAGTYSKVTVDAKGRVTVGADIGAADVNTALGYTPVNKAGDTMAGNINMGGNDITNAGNISMAANKYLGLSANSTNGTVAGQMWYDAGTIKYYDGSVVKSLGVAGAGITNVNGLTAGTQSFVTGTTGTDFNISSAGSAHTFNIPTASASNRGALSSADWTMFNAKQSSTLTDAKIWVGNSGNAATEVSISGDATVANTGALTLASSGVTAGTYSKVTVDVKGRVTVGADLVSSDIISMLGYTPVNKAGDVMMGNLSLSSVTSDPAGLVAGDEGKMWYRSDLNTIRYWDGASAISLGVAGAGITNINGLTSSTQSFVIGTAGTAPAISSAGSAHTLDIPMASTAAVTAGLISKTDYDTFNAKQSSSLASAKIWVGNSGGAATAVSMSGDATIDNAGALSIGSGKITAPMLSSGGVVTATSGVMIAGTTGNLVNFACATSGHVLKWSVTGWTCAFADAALPTLANGKVWIGNAGNAATEVTLSGDATVDNAGAVTLANSGVTAGSYAKVVVDAKGRVTAGQLMSASDITSALSYTPVNKAGDTMIGNLAMGANDITNTGNISMAANKYLGLSANSTNGTVAGQMWYDAGTIKYFDGSVVKSLGVAGAGITNINGLTSGTQSFVLGTAGTDIAISSAGSAHTFNIPTASASNRGALSSADWTIFNAKQSSTLSDAKIWVGNSGNAATEVSISGDATVANTGALTLASSGVTAGSYAKVVVDAKGRVTAGQLMSSSDITTALGFTPAAASSGFQNGGNSFGAAATLGTNDAYALNFETNNSTKMTIDSTGKVGIGTSSPSNQLHIYGSNPSLKIENTSGIAGSGSSLVFGQDQTDQTPLAVIYSDLNNGGPGVHAGGLTFQTADGGILYDRMNINRYGSVGIGVQNPPAKLTISNNTFTGFLDGWPKYQLLLYNSGAPATSYGLGIKTNTMVFNSGGGAFSFDSAGSSSRMVIDTTGNVGIGTTSPNTILDINGAYSQRGMAAPGLSPAGQGRIYFDSTANKFKVSQNGGAYADLVASGGITSLNGLSAATQSFVLGTAGTDIGISSAGSAHTFDIPTASSTNRGALSSTDWSTFNAKQSSSLASAKIWVGNSGGAATAVSISGDATIDNAGVLSIGSAKITGPMLSSGGSIIATTGVVTADASGNLGRFTCSTSGHVATWSVTGWSCAAPAALLPTLTSAKIWLGNASNAATEVSMSGDATMDNAGVVTLANSGVTAGTYAKVSVDAKGRVIASVSLASSDITTALGFTPTSAANAIVQNGNSFGGAATIGTNDAYDLSFETNNSTKMTILSGGNVGIGVASPAAKLEVQGQMLSKVYNAGASTTIDWNNGNMQYTTASCGAFTFSNMLEGGSYTLIVKGATSGTCTFSQTVPDTVAAGSFKYYPTNAASTASTTSIYSFVRAGGLAYVSWITGF